MHQPTFANPPREFLHRQRFRPVQLHVTENTLIGFTRTTMKATASSDCESQEAIISTQVCKAADGFGASMVAGGPLPHDTTGPAGVKGKTCQAA